MMDTVHCCVFLALISIIFMKCSDAQHEDGITYVSTVGIDSTSCFNAGFHNPCQSFTYVLLDAHISCDDNCVIIILDSQSEIINNIVFRKNQSLHVSKHVNLQMVNVSFGSIQLNSSGSSNMTFQNLTLIFRSVSFVSFQQVKFENVVVKYSYYSNIDCKMCFTSVDSVIIQQTYFQTFLSQGTECNTSSALVSARVNTAVFTNCSFLGNVGNFGSVVHICARTITIEQCIFESYHVQFALLKIRDCYAPQEINWSITTCSFNNNTAVYLIFISEIVKFNSGFVTISNTIFQENTLIQYPKCHVGTYSVLIYVSASILNNHSVHYLLNNNTIKNNVGPAIAGLACHFKFQINNTKISSNIANHSIVSFPNPYFYQNLCNVTLVNTNIVNNSIPQFHEHYSVVYIGGGICQIKNVTFLQNRATPLALVSTSAYFIATIMFHDNIAVYGGGIYLDHNTNVTMYENSKVVFVNNTAIYGGAVYIGEHYIYENCVWLSGQSYLKFSGNSAGTTGPNIYSYQSCCPYHAYHILNITWDTGPLIVSYPTNANISNKILEIYPGKSIRLNYSVFDCNGTDSTCIADVFLGCGDKLVCTSKNIHLAGPPTVFLSSNVIDTGLVYNSIFI